MFDLYERINAMIAHACQQHIDAGIEAEISFHHTMRVESLLRTKPRPGDVRTFEGQRWLIVGVAKRAVWLCDGQNVKKICA